MIYGCEEGPVKKRRGQQNWGVVCIKGRKTMGPPRAAKALATPLMDRQETALCGAQEIR